MPPVVLAEVCEAVRSLRLVDRLPATNYLDANAALQWARLGLLADILSLLPKPNPYARRWQMQDAVAQEVRNVGESRGWFTADVIAGHLDHENLQVDPPTPLESDLAKAVVNIRRRMADRELRENPDAPQSPRRHLGEAETLATIIRLEPDAVFVSNDYAALAEASNLGVKALHGSLFIVAAVDLEFILERELWQRICATRTCPPRQRGACATSCACPDLSAAAAEEGVFSGRVRRLTDVERLMADDIREAVTVFGA